MSYLGSNTKKVAVYGRRGNNTRIINHTPSLNENNSTLSESDDHDTPPPQEVKPKRALLASRDVLPPSKENKPKRTALASIEINAVHSSKPIKPRARRTTRAYKAAPIVDPTTSDKENVPVKPRVSSSKRTTMTKPTPIIEVVVEQKSKPAPPPEDTSVRSSSPSSGAIKPRARTNASKRITRRIIESDTEAESGDSDYLPNADNLVRRMAKVSLNTFLGFTPFPSPFCKRAELMDLLDTVSQKTLYDFTSLISSLRPSKRLEKIGEASYSEVYKISSKKERVVLKVIPIQMEEQQEDHPEASQADDVRREIRISKALGGTKSFVTLKNAFIVGGCYPQELLEAWDRWDVKRRSKLGEGAENIRPSILPPGQLYALLLMEDGGADLENVKLKSWQQAASIFWQVTDGIAQMEIKYGFEHRDLHVGNILVAPIKRERVGESNSSPVRRTRQRSTRASLPSYSTQPQWLTNSDVQATIIDFTLSRLVVKKETVAYQFQDDGLFQGEGDTQFDVYREMRAHTADKWDGFFPLTNVMWLRYLNDKLLHFKGLIPPSTSDGQELSAYTSLLDAARWTLKVASASDLIDRFHL